MDRLPVRYMAVACVIGGGLLMAGASGVALADPGGTSGQSDSGSSDAGGTQAGGPGTATGTTAGGPSGTAPAAEPGSGLPRLDPVTVPELGSSTSPRLSTPRQPTTTLNGEVINGGTSQGTSPEGQTSGPATAAEVPTPSWWGALPLVPLPDLDVPLVPELQYVLNELGVPTAPGGLPTLGTIFPGTTGPTVATGGGSAPGLPPTGAPLPIQQPALPSQQVIPLVPTMPVQLAPAPRQPLSPSSPTPAETVTVTPLSQEVEYRAGYSDDLRNAGMSQIASVALPGVGGMLLLIAGGGFFGYRQAKVGHIVTTDGIARFLR